jgi:hypothetical protein
MRPGGGSTPRRREAGFTLPEVVAGVGVLAVALLGHAASSFGEQRLARAGQYRSEAVDVARQFVERLRGDEDFAGLLSRVRLLQTDDDGAGAVTLEDGRVGYPPSSYCTGFLLPSSLSGLVVRVEAPLLDSGEGAVLREDLDLPYLGLPADLDGDGAIDDESHDLDYRALPLSLTFQWTAPGHAPATMRLATWIRGDR